MKLTDIKSALGKEDVIDFIESNERLTLSFCPEQYRKAFQICGTKSGLSVGSESVTGNEPPVGSMPLRMFTGCRHNKYRTLYCFLNIAIV